MARKAPIVTESQFKDLIIQYMSGISETEFDDLELDYDTLSEAKNGNVYDIIYTLLNHEKLGKVMSDWNKVDFDLENLYISYNHNREWQLGFQQLGTGFTYIGVVAGGDWEHPLYAIIYHDGKTFRGYVPKKGNTYNQVTNTAFGSESNVSNSFDSENKLIIKGLEKLGCSLDGITDDNIEKAWELLDFDFVQIRKDIENRIELEGNYIKKIDTSKVDKLLEKLKSEEKEESIVSNRINEVYPTSMKDYRNTSIVYVSDGKSEYVETVTVYEYQHMINAAKSMLDEGMSLAEFVAVAKNTDNVQSLAENIKQLIYIKKAKEAANRMFGEE